MSKEVFSLDFYGRKLIVETGPSFTVVMLQKPTTRLDK